MEHPLERTFAFHWKIPPPPSTFFVAYQSNIYFSTDFLYLTPPAPPPDRIADNNELRPVDFRPASIRPDLSAGRGRDQTLYPN
jgi:hypothetical protein